MAGTAMGVGILAVTATLALGAGAIGAASIRGAHAAGIADAAALAAADAASGAASGVPCALAATLAESAGAVIVACEVDGLTCVIRVRTGTGLLVAEARARAGPAGTAP